MHEARPRRPPAYVRTPVALNPACTTIPSRSSSALTASRVTSATSGGRVPSATRTRSPPGGSGTSSRIGPVKRFCALPSGRSR